MRTRKPVHYAICALSTAAAVAAACRADTISIVATRDNTLYERSDGSTSNGAGPGVYAGTSFSGEEHRALVAFDLTPHIPTGSRVTAASLRLSVTRAQASPTPARVHRVLVSWGEGTSNADLPGGQGAAASVGDATWLHRFYPGTFWANAGGDFEATASATTTVGGQDDYTWSDTPRLHEDVQQWVDAPNANHGWLVISELVFEARSARRFASREHPTAALRPVLTVSFNLPTVPCSPADLVGPGGAGGPDGVTTVDDLVAFLAAFFASNAVLADVATLGATAGEDGQITVDDLVYFLSMFFVGCP
ncbi:MAG: GC-type dockerin domain-anchored protein [Phycisphaerales bacterium]